MRMRHAEDFVNLGNRDDIEIFERTQESLAATPEVEWVDVSRGGAPAESGGRWAGPWPGTSPTKRSIRSGYEQWRRLMSASHLSHFADPGEASGTAALVDQ